MKKYSALFEPIQIGRMTIKNRIGMAPMHTKYASESGEVTEKLMEYFVARAKGGVGLIVMENTCVDWEYGKGDGNPVTIHDDRFRPMLCELVKRVHRYGVKIIPELHHAGRQTFASNIGAKTPLAPSAVQSLVGGDLPREMTEKEIWETIRNFARAARRSKQAGFDGVELHGAHGYLFSEFISPHTNLRQDKWGGSFENRCRFAMEAIRAVKKESGKDFPLFFRMSAEESAEDGLTLEEGIRYAQILEREGVDCLDVSHGTYESIKHFPMQGDPNDQLLYLAQAVKEAVHIPVIAVGGLGVDPSVAEEAIRKGKADMVHFGRELLAEPELPNKIKDSEFETARRCIRCNECTGSIDKGHYLACAVNPECGYEYQRKDRWVGKIDKRIVVVGAGPAGMEYAVTAAKRGAKVTILEQEQSIGGLARVCARSAYKSPDICHMIEYYRAMLDRQGVDLRLGIKADARQISKLNPHKVILAMGATPLALPIKGAEYAQCGIDILQNGAENLGERVCIIGGSGVGLDLAMFVSEYGKKATVLEMRGEVGMELSPMLRWHLKDMVKKSGGTIYTGCKVEKIEETKLHVMMNNEKKTIFFDSVIYAVGFQRKDGSKLKEELECARIRTEILGDMKGAGHFMDAIHTGYWYAMEE